jgi:GNAT superfamily N-acetyltransferase
MTGSSTVQWSERRGKAEKIQTEFNAVNYLLISMWHSVSLHKKKNMDKYRIETTENAIDEIEALIAEGLNQYNDEVTGNNDRRPLAVVVKDSMSGTVLGGITGRSSLGMLFLDLFYLPKSLRGSGLGSELLRRFELEGRSRGCVSAVLYTISFQAPKFYELNGWTRFGEVPCLPAGTSRIFMMKTL